MTTEVLAARGIGMSFGPVSVLRDVHLDVRAGEAHALVGENGAGKSTLGKILAGQLRPSAGTLLIDGQPARLAGIREAQARGIVLIHQELNLAGHLSVAANIFLGREPTRSGLLDQRAMDAGARDALAELGCVLDPSRTVSTLTVAQRQMVEIAKAATRTLRVLVMDEPTAVLTGAESDHLMTFIRRLQARGTAIVYVSHKLDEVLALADRVTVLRDGDRVATRPARDLSEHDVARLMVGRDVVDVFPPRAPPPADAPEVLTVSDVRVPGHVHGASFGVRRGEILGFAGLVGAGRTELMEGVMGLRAGSGGTVARDGRPVRIRTPRDAMRAGIAYLTEDRKGRGLLVRQPARPNLTLADLARYGRVFTDPSRETAALAAATAAFDIRAGDRAAAVSTYSGGNQQKLLLAKTMQTQPRVLIVDEPTRGIDIGTKQQIYRFLHALAAGGVAVIVVSSDMAEVIGMSHRVAVMRAGWIAGVLEGDAITETAIVGLATGTAEARDAAA